MVVGAFRETNAAHAMLSMVVAGCGIALLPKSIAQLAGDKIICIGLSAPRLELQQVFVYSGLSVKELDEFVALLRES